ncbi:MAG: homospermidine synthase [Hyphomicrobiales bacterium]|nr:homospermidine synthase [Hyphomicrobiales bacterium]
MKYAAFKSRLVILGFGSIGQGSLPLILRHLDISPEQILILSANDAGREIAESYGVKMVIEHITKDNLRTVLEPLLSEGDFLLNLSVDVSSKSLFTFAHERGALYLDTCIEPWPGGYTDPKHSPSQRSNYALREQALELKTEYAGGPTAVIAHGANPGLVSHFVKVALLNIARDTGLDTPMPTTRTAWANLARALDIKVIHIAERDTQVAREPKQPGEFVNTWSIDGFVGEGCQPAELGWGTHEKQLPADGHHHEFGCDSAIYLDRPGAGTKVRTWTPLEGPFHGFLVTHNESISIADYFSVHNGRGVLYRPTVHYAYHPCDDAVLSLHELAGKNWEPQSKHRLMMDEISEGIDELGVLLLGHARGAYWYGSRLSIEQTRALAPHNNATSLQVTAPVLAGMVWALENPCAGIVEADEIDHVRIMDIAGPYLGDLVGEYSDWTPLKDRSPLFPEPKDPSSPWQFVNFRVT